MSKLDMREIRILLHRKRYTLRSWAIRHKFNPTTVDKSIRRAVSRGTAPRGIVAGQIVTLIEKTIGRKVI